MKLYWLDYLGVIVHDVEWMDGVPIELSFSSTHDSVVILIRMSQRAAGTGTSSAKLI